MHDAKRVQVKNCSCKLVNDISGARFAKNKIAFLQVVKKVSTPHDLHNDFNLTFAFENIVKLNYRRMLAQLQ